METENDRKILIELLKDSPIRRSILQKKLNLSPGSLHIALNRMILNGNIKVKQIKGVGNPTEIIITEQGKILAEAYGKI